MVLDDDVLAPLTGTTPHLTLVPVVQVVRATDRAGGGVVPILGAVSGADAGGRASVRAGDAAGTDGAKLVGTRILGIWREHITGVGQ